MSFRHTFEAGYLDVCLFKERPGKLLTFTAKDGDVYETDHYQRVINVGGASSGNSIYRTVPDVAVHPDEVDVSFRAPEIGESVSAKLMRRPDPIRDLNRKLDAMSTRIIHLEADVEFERKRSSAILAMLLTAGFSDNKVSTQLTWILDLMGGANLSELKIDVSQCISWESDVFERLIRAGYDLRNVRYAFDQILNLIDMNWTAPWYEKFERVMTRIITLANANLDLERNEHVNWGSILAMFNERNRDAQMHLIAPSAIASGAYTLWHQLADKLRVAIQVQIARGAGIHVLH